MKVITKAEFQMVDSNGKLEFIPLSEESYEYDGPVSEMKGGGGSSSTTTVQKADPWGGVQPYLSSVFSRAQDLSQTPSTYFPGQTYAEFDPLQTQAFQSQLGAADQMGGQLADLYSAQQSALQSTDVANNPYIAGQADVIERRLNRNLMENLLPSITSQARLTGNVGGSRPEIARGIATRGTQESLGDALAQLYGGAYGQGLEAQGRAMALAPQTLQTSLLPSQIYGQVGSQLQGQEQLGIDEAMQRYAYEQNAPWAALERYSNLLQGGLGFSNTTGTTTGPRSQSNPMAGALGGGMMGYSAAPMLGLTGPFGALGGAVLGGLFS
jgi:hypothetical protein